jgi:type II secretory pathway component PulF
VSRRVAISDGARAEIFLGLARTLSAGLDPARALESLTGTRAGAFDHTLKRAAATVRAGGALVPALDRQGLVSATDRVLLDAGEATGSLDWTCLALAERYARAQARWRRLRARLMLPGAVLAIGILVLPLPALARGDLGAGGYVLRSAGTLTLLALATKLVSGMVRAWRAGGSPGWLTRLARALPLAGTFSRLHQRADACEHLAMTLACGLPAADALRNLQQAEPNPVRRAALARAGRELAAGAGLAEALRDAALLDPPGHAIVTAGEGAGRLDDALQRVAGAAHGNLDGRYELLARWVPVAAYTVVAGAITAALLG